MRTWLIRLLVSCACAMAPAVWSQAVFPSAAEPVPRYLARIELHTADELHAVLKRAEKLFASGQFQPGRDTPVAFLLHGSEADVFFSANYLRHKPIVDLAARLSALQVVDIKVCETWMHRHPVESELLPFVDTVPYAPNELERLLRREAYIYF